MAVVTFTSNASTGAGSLAEAIANAQPGDVIRPDETVFERGSTIEIALASRLNVDKNLTLDASPFRVRLDGGGAVRCAHVATDVIATFIGFDFVGGAGLGASSGGGVSCSGRLTLDRCGVYGCFGNYGGGVFAQGALTLNDCVLTGCRASGSGGAITALNGLTLRGTTVVGNVSTNAGADVRVEGGDLSASNSIIGKVNANGATSATYSGSVVDVASSNVGFVAPPPDDLTPETWDANAWQSWNLRLLDDASGAPSPYRDSGDVDTASKYDLDGNFRGRETNGVATRSPGAYETIQADLFWVGVDSTGVEVVSPSFLTSDGWAASRFATVSGDAAPQFGRTVFVDGNVHFVDVLSTTSAQTFGLTVGGGAVAAIDAASRVYFGKLQIALGASFTLTGITQPRKSARCGAWSRINSQFDAAAPCDFDVTSYFVYAIFYMAYVPNAATYGTLRVATEARDMIRLSGEYVCDVFSTTQNGTATDQTIRVGDDGATIRARQFRFGGDGAANYVKSFFDRPVTLKLQGAASVSTPPTFRESWADNFLIDVTDATSATLTLCGQTIYGDAPTAAVELSGSAKINERGLDVASLVLNADASLLVNGGSVKAATLTLDAGTIVTFSGIDTTFAATETATVGAATFTGIGYFATPPGTDTTSASFTENVRNCDYGANVSSFNAFPTSADSANLSWVKQNQTPSVLIESANGSGWNVVNNKVVGDLLAVNVVAPKNYRLFDGENFFTASARPYGTAYELAEEQTIGYLKTLISTGYLN